MQTVAVVGVGLIGGSFALALRAAGFTGTVLGVSSERSTRAALERGAIDAAAPLEEAAARADLIYLSQPIGGIIDSLGRLRGLVRPQTLVTDAGSTKAAIVRAARGMNFLGGHPMAGKEARGVEEAEAALFRGRTYVLTPETAEGLETPAAAGFVEWLKRIGAEPLPMSAAEHDLTVAATSHVPQLASTALASMVAERVPGERIRVAGSGLADMTRLALSSYSIWRDILATNTEAIDQALLAYIEKLQHIRENLRTRESQREFERAAELAARVRRDA